MLKYISTGSALLLAILCHAQEKETPTGVFEIQTKGHIVSVNTVYKELHYSLPSHILLHEIENDKTLYKTETRRGKLNGTWQSWYKNGKTCDSGRLVNNIPDGEWKHWNEQGELIAIRHYSAAKFHRVTNEMSYYHPRRNFYHLSTLYQQNKKASLYHIDAAYSFPRTRMVALPQTLKELVQHNITDHTVYKPVFEQCLHEGDYINYFPGGVVKDSGNYKDGLKQGKWIHRDSAEGQWWQGAYQDGHKIREWKHYDKKGKLLEILVYNNRGELSWRKKIAR
jgi:antitoxin component YwqK of YwqJK toxin-antitoxin module